MLILLSALRTLAAILLLFILSFNWFGYQFVSHYLQNRATRLLAVKLDCEEYAERDLIELKIPVSLPYQNNHERFERYDGEIEINGIHYTYVKRRIINDSIILLCLPNKEKTKMVNAKDNFFKLVNGLHSTPWEKNTGKGNAAVYKNALPEFLTDENISSIYNLGHCLVVKFPITNISHQSAGFKELPEIPPENIVC